LTTFSSKGNFLRQLMQLQKTGLILIPNLYNKIKQIKACPNPWLGCVLEGSCCNFLQIKLKFCLNLRLFLIRNLHNKIEPIKTCPNPWHTLFLQSTISKFRALGQVADFWPKYIHFSLFMYSYYLIIFAPNMKYKCQFFVDSRLLIMKTIWH